jgi:hypothetical protein
VLTDEQIAALSATERRELIARLVRPVEELVPSRRWLRRTREVRVAAMVLSAVVLVPWIGYLAATLPRVYAAQHWDVAWVGFDLVLLALIVATAVLGYLRRQLLILTAFAAGVLLVCDAWFDVLTARGDDQTWSLVTALVVELPLAGLLIAGALQVLRLVAARAWLLEPGAHAWQIPIPLPSAGDQAVRRRGR